MTAGLVRPSTGKVLTFCTECGAEVGVVSDAFNHSDHVQTYWRVSVHTSQQGKQRKRCIGSRNVVSDRVIWPAK